MTGASLTCRLDSMATFATLEDEIRHRFRKKKQGITKQWFPVTCRTAAKFLKNKGLNIRVPKIGYEVDVATEDRVTTILTNRSGKCEFTFYRR